MSQEPKVTRFGADPTVAQELATKAYVDSQVGVRARFVFGSGQNNKSANNLNFNPIGASGVPDGGENILLAIDFAFEIQRHRCGVTSNSKDATTTFHIRDDASNVTTITVTAASTGRFDSGALTVAVASGSIIGPACDTSGSTTGTIKFTHLVTCEAD